MGAALICKHVLVILAIFMRVFSQMTWKGHKDIYQNRDVPRLFRDNGLSGCILHFGQSIQIYETVILVEQFHNILILVIK